jgi:hypothetical protein
MKPTLCIVILLVLAVSTSFPITLTTSRLSSWACLHQDFSHTPKALPHLQKLCPHLQMLCFSIFFLQALPPRKPPPPWVFLFLLGFMSLVSPFHLLSVAWPVEIAYIWALPPPPPKASTLPGFQNPWLCPCLT